MHVKKVKENIIESLDEIFNVDFNAPKKPSNKFVEIMQPPVQTGIFFLCVGFVALQKAIHQIPEITNKVSTLFIKEKGNKIANKQLRKMKNTDNVLIFQHLVAQGADINIIKNSKNPEVKQWLEKQKNKM